MASQFNIYRTARKVRIAVSVIAAVAIFAAVALGYDLWLNRWQFVPALMAGAFIWVALWLIVTAIAGRAYCSTMCPMGTVFDIFGHAGHRRSGYFFSPSRVMVRRSICVIAVAALLMGVPIMFNLLEPAAAFSRMAAWSAGPIFRPVAFSLVAGLTAALTLGVAGFVAWKRGRLLCNTVCPVGAVLAEVARFSLYHIDINTDKCIGCGRCTERCKAECIDPSAHTVDPARCVLCFDCTSVCPNSAITYRRGRHRLVMPMMQALDSGNARFNETSCSSAETSCEGQQTRREFLATVFSGLPLASMLASAPLNPDLEPLNPVHPPGLQSAEELRLRCTSCGACSAACPSGIIRPMESLRSLRAPLRPVLEFDSGWCRYDCVKCTQVCPTEALEPLTVSEKHIFVIGKARVVPQFCLEFTQGEGCSECVRRCPRQAITIAVVERPESEGGQPASVPELTPGGKVRRLPQVDSAKCIGCGACRFYCPGRPRAFVIEGEF